MNQYCFGKEVKHICLQIEVCMSNLLTSFQRVDAEYEEWATRVDALENSLEEPSNWVELVLTGNCLIVYLLLFTMSFFDDRNFHTFFTILFKYHMGVFLRFQP